MLCQLGEAQSVDVGCGRHVVLRSSPLCVIFKYERGAHAHKGAYDKAFPAPVVLRAVRGNWEFHGTRGRAVIEETTVIAGSLGLNWGCRHSAESPSYADILALKPEALDVDEPLFKHEVLNGLRLPDLKRLLSMENLDELDSLVFDIFDYVSRASLVGHPLRHRVNLRVQRMKRFIEHHAFENISLSDIAGSADMSIFTSIRQFKRRTGATPFGYLNRLRVERAQTLLKDRRLAIAEVAHRVGIRDRFYFTRWFTKQTGVSPQRFREMVTN